MLAHLKMLILYSRYRGIVAIYIGIILKNVAMVGGPRSNGRAREIILVSENAIDVGGCETVPG